MPVREDTRSRGTSPNARMSGKQATEEQRRMAELISPEALAPDLEQKVRRVMEFTQCSAEVAHMSLHENSFDPTLACEAVLSKPKDSWVWSTTTKNTKKTKTEFVPSRRGGSVQGFAKGTPGRGRNNTTNGSSETSSEMPRQNGRSERNEGFQKDRPQRSEFKQRTESRGLPSSRGRGGGSGASNGRGGMVRASSAVRPAAASAHVVNGISDQSGETTSAVTAPPLVTAAVAVSPTAVSAPRSKTPVPVESVPVAAAPASPVAAPVAEAAALAGTENVNVPANVVLVRDVADPSQYLYTFPANAPLAPSVGVCRIHRSQIPDKAVVMPKQPTQSSNGALQFIQSVAVYSGADDQLSTPAAVTESCVGSAANQIPSAVNEPIGSPRSPRVRQHSRGHSRSHSNASNNGVDIAEAQQLLGHYPTENEVASAVARQAQDHRAASPRMRDASPQPPANELPTETATFASMPEARAIHQQSVLATHHQQQQQSQPHLILHQQQQQQAQALQQQATSPIHSLPQQTQHNSIPQNNLPTQQRERTASTSSAQPTPTAVLLRNPAQHNTSQPVAGDAPVSAADLEPPTNTASSDLTSSAATAPVPTVESTFTRTLPAGVSTANPPERSLQDGRSAALNAAASLASAPSASESQQPPRGQSGNKSGPGMYAQGSNGFMPQPFMGGVNMSMMPAPYSDYDATQSRSRMNGMHDGVQTTYQAGSGEQSASSNGVLGPAPSGNMSMMPQQQQQQQQQPLHPFYNMYTGYVYPPGPPFTGMAHYGYTSAHGQRSHPYSGPYMGGPPNSYPVLPGYDEEAGGYQGGSGQGQVKGGNNSTSMTAVSSASVNSDSFKSQNFDAKGMYGVTSGPYNMPAGVQQTYMHNNPGGNMMGRNMPPPQVPAGAATHYSQHGMHPGMMDNTAAMQSVRGTNNQGGMSSGGKHHQPSNSKYTANHGVYTATWQ